MSKVNERISLVAAATLLASIAAAQAPDDEHADLSLRTAPTAKEDVLVLPSSVAAVGRGHHAGIAFDVSTSAGVRSYRATVGGRTAVTHTAVGGPATHLAFERSSGRFRKIASAIRVELDDYANLEERVREVGGLSGKAYPHLGFALIDLPGDVHPADAVNRLNGNAGTAAKLLFAEPTRRPAVARARATSRHATNKFNLSADLLVSTHGIRIAEDGRLTARFVVRNWGALVSNETMLFVSVARTPSFEASAFSASRAIPALMPKDSYVVDIPISFETPPASRAYYTLAIVAPQANELPGRTFTNEDVSGIVFKTDGSPQLRCHETGRGGLPGSADPLFAQQWHLRNRGQRAYADTGGMANEDLRLGNILTNGPYGTGVRVAVVDTGLEVCHPDLRANVEADASFNFNVGLSTDSAWWGAATNDPFNPYPAGDHGTSVAGLIAAEAENGIGGRGVAPRVRLRGYNFLNEMDNSPRVFLDSHGASGFAPDSSDVDIFNLSYGSLPWPANASAEEHALFSYGTRRLRDGLGAIYVKSAGNSFNGCSALRQTLNERLGCADANGDSVNNLPYVIVVGGLNANGTRASYSSVGANLWVSAPAGEYGFRAPAMLTTDQSGAIAGYGVVYGDRLSNQIVVNPHRDYTSSFNGTSSAAPNLSGAIAILLDAVPTLTWRDVKHVLAKTARRVHAGIPPVADVFGEVRRVVRHAWTVNGAGYRFHNWYGFGAVDTGAALAEARRLGGDALGAYRRSGWFEGGANLSIPDNDGTGAEQELVVAGLPVFANIEAVVLEIHLDHAWPHDIGIQLISPAGTPSIVNTVFNDALAYDRARWPLRWQLLSNAFYGENPNGTWRLSVFDGADEDVGMIRDWRLRFDYGDHPAPETESE